MKLKFWGSRGSSPATPSHARTKDMIVTLLTRAKAAGIANLDELGLAVANDRLGVPLSFGGHTPCVEVSHTGFHAFVDMGSGLREAGAAWIGKRREFDFYLTHLHWDHLIGLNFFAPIFVPGHTLTIHHVHKAAPDSVRTLFNGTNFPIKWEQLGAKVEFREMKIHETENVGGTTVTPFALDHPGGSFGYRFEAGGKSAVIAFDGEFKRVSREALGRDLRFYQNLDLLVFDAQYGLDDLMSKFDWGHCSPTIGVDLALREGVRRLVLLHHDPAATDEHLRQSLRQAQEYAAHQQRKKASSAVIPLEIQSCYDGLEIDLEVLPMETSR